VTMSGGNFTNATAPVMSEQAQGSAIAGMVGQAVDMVGSRNAMNMARQFVSSCIWPEAGSESEGSTSEHEDQKYNSDEENKDEWGMAPDDGTGPTPAKRARVESAQAEKKGDSKEDFEPVSVPEPAPPSSVVQEDLKTVPFMSCGRVIGGLRALALSLAPTVAPTLSPVNAVVKKEVEDLVDEMSVRMGVSFSVQSILSAVREIATSEIAIAKLQAQIEEIQASVADTKALMPTYQMIIKMRQVASSKTNKRNLAVGAMSCRVQEAKRRR